MIITEERIEFYARFFAQKIIKLLQQQEQELEQIIVNLTANLGAGKTWFVDLVKSWLTSSNITSQGLSFFGFNIIEFELDGKLYKILHLDASLMKSQRLLNKIPGDIKEYKFIFIEHPNLIIYRDLLKKLKILKNII